MSHLYRARRRLPTVFCCHRRRYLAELADVVTPLVYAVAGGAAAQHLSEYKNASLRRDRDRSAAVVAALLAAGLRSEPCVAAALGIRSRCGPWCCR